MKPLHLAAALLMVGIWGFNFVVIRWGLNGVPPLTLTMMRFALAAFPAVFFVKRLPRASWPLVFLYGCFAFALQFALLFSGMAAGMPAGLSSLVIQAQVFFTIALVALLMGERTRLSQLTGAVVAGAGLTLVALHLPSSTQLGFALVIGAAMAWAIANLLVKKIKTDQPLAVVVWGSAAAALVLLPLAFVIEGPAVMLNALRGMGPAAWAGLAFQAWPTTLVAFGLWGWLLRRYPTSLVAPFPLLVPIFGMSCAIVLLNEAVTWWKLVAAALVISGLALNLAASRTART